VPLELLAVGVVVVGAVVATDRLLAAAAVRRIASRVGLAGRAETMPVVRIAGSVFLTQLLAGVYRDVEVTLGACTVGGIDFSRLSAQLSDVRAPIRQLLAGHGMTAGELTATATIPFSVLSDRLPPGLTIRPQGDDLRISGMILLVPVLGILGITANRNKISVTPKMTGFPAPVGFVIDLPAMPPQVRITSVRVTGAGLEVQVRGANVSFASAQ